MPRWTAAILLACCVASAAQAAPPTEMPDDMQRVLVERGLIQQTLGHIEQVGQTMRDTTSDLVGTAMGFLGVPYRRGGNSAESGFDCSGFVRAVYSQTVGLVLPRRANEQAAATDTIDKRDLQPGDLVFFNTMRRAFSHVGIYVGDGKFVHAPRSGAKVRVEDMDSSYWKRRFDGARRVETDTPLDARTLTTLGASGN
ncbi:C40 family peptidase [Pseudorhodoferax sp.]|uniref:C40 family peptidase n=1 Tax=Pseudorhodoferax sp. TaxID=1993553 RepID=UPI002DD63500|nr:C40 family peptidase [Pseudorhodoferax sp.]